MAAADSADRRDPWLAEADAFADNVEQRDYDVANAAQLPEEQWDLACDAADDEGFDQKFDEWFDYLFEGEDLILMLALEQSCSEGILLPWDMRAVRLATLPEARLAQLHWIFKSCPEHVLAYLAKSVYWIVRSERARRRGAPHWTPQMSKPPLDPSECVPAFKPMRSWPQRWP